MISYELAKELKLRGFRQKWIDSCTFYDSTGVLFGPLRVSNKAVNDMAGGAKIPSLSEIILAIGDDFEALTMEHSQGGNEWVASSFHSHKYARGESPDVAAARLYIALHPLSTPPARTG